MKFWPKKLSLSFWLLLLLPVLLIALAALQYQWLSQISQAERERLQARLQADVRRFAEEFNSEITRAYFIFQFDADIWQENQAKILAERYELWQKQVNFPDLVSEIYLVKNENEKLSWKKINFAVNQAETIETPADFVFLQDKLQRKSTEKQPFMFNFIEPSIPALLVPIAPKRKDLAVRQNRVEVKVSPFDHEGFTVIKLNLDIIRSKLLPELAKKHLSDENGNSYSFSVVDREKPEQIIFQSSNITKSVNADATANMFEISPDSSNVLVLAGNLPRVRMKTSSVTIFQKKIETKTLPDGGMQTDEKQDVNVQVLSNGESPGKIIERAVNPPGHWLLNVQYTDGSLENFVNKTRWRNLGISFGILALLGASVVLLLLSTRRAQLTAQRQLDFVSSVTHEFRTPLAVINSAGENLADGIVKNASQIEKYGALITRESNRLTEMVEQILQFAGARAKGRKFDFQPTEIGAVISDAITDCQPLLDEKGFEVEKNIQENLPSVIADANALRQSLQNLINNAAKYSNGTRWIKISASNGDGKIKISVEDKGIGIDKRELKNIFEPFFRGQEAVAEQIHGNGLGLSLVKQIVDAHHGEISVESEKGKGSRFTITIPVESL